MLGISLFHRGEEIAFLHNRPEGILRHYDVSERKLAPP
jgi:hypothetical protein